MATLRTYVRGLPPTGRLRPLEGVPLRTRPLLAATAPIVVTRPDTARLAPLLRLTGTCASLAADAAPRQARRMRLPTLPDPAPKGPQVARILHARLAVAARHTV